MLTTLHFFHGSRTYSAKHLKVSIRTLRNWIVEYEAQGYYVPKPHCGPPCACFRASD